MEITDKAVRFALRVFPYKFIRHYVYPHLVRAKKRPYNRERFWESYYSSAKKAELSDGVTVAHNYDPLMSAYHYNVVENLIIEALIDQNISSGDIDILDIGSGAGHWIQFYCDLMKPRVISGYEISATAVDALKTKFVAMRETCSIYRQDIAAEDFTPRQKFDLVNAIGVMFHIVDDGMWRKALHNISSCLRPEGHFFVGGQFGKLGRSVQFHNRDSFSNWSEYTSYVTLKELRQLSRKDEVLVNKRVRSRSHWRRECSRVGLEVVSLYRSQSRGGFVMPENNLLVLRKKR